MRRVGRPYGAIGGGRERERRGRAKAVATEDRGGSVPSVWRLKTSRSGSMGRWAVWAANHWTSRNGFSPPDQLGHRLDLYSSVFSTPSVQDHNWLAAVRRSGRWQLLPFFFCLLFLLLHSPLPFFLDKAVSLHLALAGGLEARELQ